MPPLRHRMLAVLATATLGLAAMPAVALAHGDPASHYLETDQLYPGFANRPSQPVELQLMGLLEAARRADYPIKLAIVGSRDDLTEDASMFGRPQDYADYVAQRLGPGTLRAPVVIVTPRGIGVAGVQQRNGATVPVDRRDAPGLAGAFDVPQQAGGDELAHAATLAVRRIARRGGHALPARVPPATVITSRARPGDAFPLRWLPPVAIFATVFLSAWLYFETRTRRARRRHDANPSLSAPAPLP